MVLDIALILIGLILLVIGGDRFITGASAMARNLGVSPLLVGLTIVGFGTSAPEMFVSAVAALNGNPGIAVGNALGSNITNIGLVIGLTALIVPLRVQSTTLQREFPMLFGVMLLVAVLFSDGELGRWDGVILLVTMVLISGWMVRLGLRQSSQSEPLKKEFAEQIPANMPMRRAIGWIVIGFILLPLGSESLVQGAASIAQRWGVSDLVIGLTVVAIGTSLPELMASLIGALRGEHDIAIGNVLGSNMFNLLAVLGLPGVIAPTHFGSQVLLRDFPFMVILTIILYFMSHARQHVAQIGRVSGLLLVSIYVVYLLVLFYFPLT